MTMPSHTPCLSDGSNSDSWNKSQGFFPEPQIFPTTECPPLHPKGLTIWAGGPCQLLTRERHRASLLV